MKLHQVAMLERKFEKRYNEGIAERKKCVFGGQPFHWNLGLFPYSSRGHTSEIPGEPDLETHSNLK